MPFVISCPKCSGRYSAPDHLRGQTVQCPSCSNSFVADDPSVRSPMALSGASATAVVNSPPKTTATTTFVTSCTHCGQRFSAPANVHGQMVRCPGCSQSFKAMPLQSSPSPVPKPSTAAPAANAGDWKWFEENFEPYKPPVAEKETKRKPHISIDKHLFEQQPKRLRMAGRFTRLAARMVDGFLFWGIGVFILAVSSAGMTLPRVGQEISDQQASEQRALLGILIGWAVILGVINLICLAARGQTLGKMLLGIKIVGSDGYPCFGRILGIRMIAMGVLCSLPFVGFFIAIANVLMIFRENNRCMHDELADTIVVRAR